MSEHFLLCNKLLIAHQISSITSGGETDFLLGQCPTILIVILFSRMRNERIRERLAQINSSFQSAENALENPYEPESIDSIESKLTSEDNRGRTGYRFVHKTWWTRINRTQIRTKFDSTFLLFLCFGLRLCNLTWVYFWVAFIWPYLALFWSCKGTLLDLSHLRA